MADISAPQAASGADIESPDAYDILSLSQTEFDGGDEIDAAGEQPEDGQQVEAEAPEVGQPKEQQPSQFQQFQQFAIQQEQRFAAMLQQQNANTQQLIASLVERLAPQAAAVDPFSQLDPNDPDYFTKQLELKNQILQERLDKLEGQLTSGEQKREQERQTSEQKAYVARMTAWRDENVTRAADLLFAGYPASALVTQAKNNITVNFDSEWRSLSEQHYGVPYHKDAYAIAFNRIKPQMAMFANLKVAPKSTTPATTQTAQAKTQPQQAGAQAEFIPYFQRKGA